MLPTESETHLRAAAGAMREGDPKRATKHVDAVLAAIPDHPGANRLRGAIHLHLGESALAVPYLRAAVAAGLDAPGVGVVTLAELGVALAQSGDAAGGIDALRDALKFSPGNTQIALALGQALLDNGEAAEAEPLLRRAVAAKPIVERAWLVLGRLLFEAHRDEEARETFTAITQRDPNHIPAIYNLALLDQRAGRYAEAAARFARCRGTLGPARALMLGWAQCLLELGQIDAALGLFRELLKVDRDAYAAALRTLTTASKGCFHNRGGELRAMLGLSDESGPDSTATSH
ncbi:MAG: tetratricopeptide repeat protein [Rhodospirillaceae bacterium]|nr:tetratricopeptide repeat protein [Rhodospirillaceae bacterium]